MSNQKLLTKEQILKLPDLYQTDGTDALCQIKLFTPDSHFTWFILECSHEDKDTCFGLVKSYEMELGYFSLGELSSVRGMLNLPIEVDESFKPTKLSQIRKAS